MAVLLASASWAASKTEDDLRAQLAASEAARAALAKNLDKLTKASDARSKQLTTSMIFDKAAAQAAATAAAQAAATAADLVAGNQKTMADMAQKQLAAANKTSADTSWNPFLLALVAASAGVIGPAFMVWMQGRNRRVEKEIDYAREDSLEQRTKARDDVQSAKLDQIHTLVNSNLTAYMQDTLDARRAYLVLLLSTPNPSADAQGFIATTRAKVAELEAQLNDRKKQTDVAARRLDADLKERSR